MRNLLVLMLIFTISDVALAKKKKKKKKKKSQKNTSESIDSADSLTNKIESKTFSLNFNPLALSNKSISGNAELLVAPNHGLLAEGSFITDTDYSGFGVGGGYRYHFSPSMDSMFLGLYGSYTSINGTYYEFGSELQDFTPYNYNIAIFRAGANFGRRWAWNSGFNIVLRIGYGVANSTITYENDIEPALKSLVESISDSFAAFDGEFSLGWAF